MSLDLLSSTNMCLTDNTDIVFENKLFGVYIISRFWILNIKLQNYINWDKTI